jgi:hypothetical protein
VPGVYIAGRAFSGMAEFCDLGEKGRSKGE